MRILHTADLHLGKALENQDRLQEQQAVLSEIVSIAEEKQCDLVVIAGDVFDSFIPSAAAEKLFFTFLAALADHGRRGVVAIAGNHDQPERLAASAVLATEAGIFLLGNPNTTYVAQKPSPFPYIVKSGKALHLHLPCGEEISIAAMPYLSEARLNELYLHDLGDENDSARDYAQRLEALLQEQAAEFSPAVGNITIAHLFANGGVSSDSERPVSGAMQVGGSLGVGLDIFPDCDYVALGHLHRPQIIQAKEGRPYVVYAGSPLAYSFSEADQTKRVMLCDIEVTSAGKQVSVYSVDLQAGLKLHTEIAENYLQALDWCRKPENQQCWLDLRIRLEQPLSTEEIDALRSAHPRLVTITPLYRKIEQPSLAKEKESLSIAQQFMAFATEREGVDCDEALLKAFLELLETEDE